MWWKCVAGHGARSGAPLCVLPLLLTGLRHGGASAFVPPAWPRVRHRLPTRVQLDEVLTECVRMREFAARNYTWPLADSSFRPNTRGWRRIFRRRFEQISQVTDLNERYNGWVSAVTSAYVLQNYTDCGYGLTRAPDDLVAELRRSLSDGLDQGRTRPEAKNEIIQTSDSNPLPPLFIDQPALNRKVLHALLPLHESWASIRLTPEISYGLRLYRNNSSLLMHTDKPDTHIIASILHVDHSEDSEPWPIVLEDFQGRTHEIVMEPGDLLLYESAKVYHGRPKKFSGSWYCSVFTHYSPEDWDRENFHWEGHFGVPPNWFVDSENLSRYPSLEVFGTALKEPESRHGWSPLAESRKLSGPFNKINHKP